MTYEPRTLLDVRAYLMPRTGLPAVGLGIAGDRAHKDAGTSYHLGADDLKMWKDPYSARHPRDRAGLSNAAAAIDVGWWARLVEMTAWMVAQARAGRRPDTREIIGPGGDGRAYRWAVENRWQPQLRRDGDSHEWHVHESFFRDSEYRDKVGLFRPFFEEVEVGYGTVRAGAEGDAARWVQDQVLLFDPHALDDVGGRDGVYGPGTAAAVARLFGGDGSVFGPDQYRRLRQLLDERYRGGPVDVREVAGQVISMLSVSAEATAPDVSVLIQLTDG